MKRKEYKALVELLQGMLSVQTDDIIHGVPEPLHGLSKQQLRMIGALYRAYPGWLDGYSILEASPPRDHVKGDDRALKSVTTLVAHLRKKLGKDAITTIWGSGYRLGHELYLSIKNSPSTAPEAWKPS